MNADERMAVIRDAFLEGRDHEAVLTLLDMVTESVANAKGLPNALALSKDAAGRPGVWLPFRSEAMEPGDPSEVIARPQRPFRPTTLMVASSCAASFVISGITFGTSIQGALSYGEVSAEIFSTARRLPLAVAFDAVMPGMDCRVTVRNVGERTARFDGILWGYHQ